MNDSGQVTGTWGTFGPVHAFLYSNGTMTGLPAPAFTGSFGCQGRAINNNGQIAGICWDTGDNAHLVLWQNGTVTDLGMLGNLASAETLSINNNGQIAGWAGSPNGSNGFLYSNGTITSLGSFFAAAINDNGVMVGGPSIDSGGTVQNLNTLIPAGSGYQIQDATAINDNGQIVANAYDTPTNQGHALLLNPVGTVSTGSGSSQTLAGHFDGTSWSVVPAPALNSSLRGVAGAGGAVPLQCVGRGHRPGSPHRRVLRAPHRGDRALGRH